MLGTGSLLGKPKNKTTDKVEPRRYPKPVLPTELPARLKIVQKYKRDGEGNILPEDHVTITYNYVGRGKGGQFKVPRATLETFWKAMQ